MECKSNEKLQNSIPRTPNMEYVSVQKPHIVHSALSEWRSTRPEALCTKRPRRDRVAHRITTPNHARVNNPLNKSSGEMKYANMLPGSLKGAPGQPEQESQVMLSCPPRQPYRVLLDRQQCAPSSLKRVLKQQGGSTRARARRHHGQPAPKIQKNHNPQSC